ncbi:MAG TPA: F0F1 ATP synthase subunit A [Steroidobacter sp.]|jgi:F-type H+-transporting ATPase subunit a|nr:F0F1 ATP synthase subunit A [Steroidobacteraceae bacterium]HLS80634.1 F0F1 ATP synthase subunit A [Steroidobacter sp.]
MAASESGAEHGGMAEYISHHLQHLANGKQAALFDLSVIHLDTLFFSILCGVIVLTVLRLAARRATAGVPGRFQAFVEMIVEFVDEQAKSIVHGKLDFIAPLALTVFLWVATMNAIDLLPVDWFPTIASWFGIHYLRPLPTADVNGAFGLSVAVLALAFFYNIKIKGLGGWLRQWLTSPFGMNKITLNPLTWIAAVLLAFANVVMTAIEYIGATFSHGMRLFGNMYAGELIFFLIAGLGGSVTIFGVVMHLFTGTIWAVFHILIVLLQAFIFMMLTLVYIGQAHEHH